MKTQYAVMGRVYVPHDPSTTIKSLPVATYSVGFDKDNNAFFLTQIDNMTVPSKLYGNVEREADRIINTHYQRKASTGVLLHGEKGTGKSMLAKLIAVKMITERSAPVILVNTPFFGDKFNNFIAQIEQDCVVMFDEYEKTYREKEHQEALLTLFDGTYNTNKLFVLTCNDKYQIDKHMLNRPGRIYYSLDFGGLSDEFIHEFCSENLKNKTYIDGVKELATFFTTFTFDMLSALVEEMNRYGETAAQAVKFLNIDPTAETFGRQIFDLKFYIEGKEIDAAWSDGTEMHGHPLTFNGWNVRLDAYESDDPQYKTGGLTKDISFNFSSAELVKADNRAGVYTYVPKAYPEITIVATKRPMKSYYSMLS